MEQDGTVIFGDPQGEAYVFIGGVPRSGLTLLHNMLNAHPLIYGAPEFPFVKDILDLKVQLDAGIETGAVTAVCNRAQAAKVTREWIDGIGQPILKDQHCRLISEKSPHNALMFDELTALFPKARCIQVVRDPRGVVASLLRVGERALKEGETPPAMTRNAGAAVEFMLAYLEGIAGARSRCRADIFTVRLEDLVGDPDKESRRVCDYLGCKWDPAMLMPTLKSHPAEKALRATASIWYDPSLFNRNPDPSALTAWKTELKPMEVRFIEKAFADHPYTREYGYVLKAEKRGWFGKRR